MASDSPLESVDRALAILELVAAAGPSGLALADISSRLGVHKTTVHRSLAALRHREFVAQDSLTGVYSLGARAITLADPYLAGDGLATLLHPALTALSRDVDELVHLGVLSGGSVVYLDKVEPERAVRVWSAVGRRSPAAKTAMGRALLAARVTSKAALAGYVEGVDVDPELVWSELEAARSRGYATEWEANEPGIACVAIAILRDGSPIAAASVTAPLERVTGRDGEIYQRMRAVLPPLLPLGLRLAD